jgi:hypothetical protein
MAYWSTPGVFNVLDPWAGGTAGMVAGATVSYTQAVANAEILQAAIWAAQIASATSCGSLVVAGEVVIPGHSIVPPPVNPGGTGDAGAIYLLAIPPVNAAFNAAIVINCNWPVLIRGTGNVKLEMMLDSNHNSGDMFYLQTSEGDNTGGITFEDLILAYPSIPNQTSTMYWSAVHTATLTLGGSDGGAENVRLNRVALLDCPIGCWFEMALQPSLLNCSISWASNFGIGVMLGDGINGGASAKEVYIAGCVFEVSAMNAPSGQTAIQIGACDHVRVENCQIDGVSYGIIITPGAGPGSTSPPLVTPVNAVHLSFTGVNVYCANKPSGAQGMACVVQPATANQAVAQIVFQGCTFELSDTAHPATGGPGILVIQAVFRIKTSSFELELRDLLRAGARRPYVGRSGPTACERSSSRLEALPRIRARREPKLRTMYGAAHVS